MTHNLPTIKPTQSKKWDKQKRRYGSTRHRQSYHAVRVCTQMCFWTTVYATSVLAAYFIAKIILAVWGVQI